MGNIFNQDFRDFLKCLNSHEVKYILVGGFSVILHGIQELPGTWIFGWNGLKKIIRGLEKHLMILECHFLT